MAVIRMRGRDIAVFIREYKNDHYHKLKSSDASSISDNISEASPALFATSCSLQLTKQTETIIDKDSSTTGIIETTRDEWTITSDNFVASDFSNVSDPIALLLDDSPVEICISAISNPDSTGLENDGGQTKNWGIGEYGYYGVAKCTSANLNAPAEGRATISATFTGSGPLLPIRLNPELSKGKSDNSGGGEDDEG